MYDSKIEEYRLSFTGTNCKYCKYYKYVIPSMPFCSDYEECILRDKIIKFPCRAKFCKYYTIKEE